MDLDESEGAPARTNREPRSAADLLGEAVWHLRQIVRLKAEVICHRARLCGGIPNELNVGRTPQLSARTNLVADCGQEVHD
jgi:hypothetical protein